VNGWMDGWVGGWLGSWMDGWQNSIILYFCAFCYLHYGKRFDLTKGTAVS